METVQLDKDTTLDLLDGEVVIYAHKVLLNKGFNNWRNFTITNKRIALVPYPKNGKETEAVETINYSDLYMVAIKDDPVQTQDLGTFNVVFNETKKLLGFIPVRKKIMFLLRGSVKEMTALCVKYMVVEGGKSLRDFVNDMDAHYRIKAINERTDLNEWQKSWAVSAEWDKIASERRSEYARLFEKGTESNRKPTPVDRMRHLVLMATEAKALYEK